MAPVRKRTVLRARASRANDPRGKYAPPPASADTTTAPDDLLPDADESPADTHTGPAAGKRSAETAFGFDSNEGFKVSKKDKRTIRHNQLLAKVQDADARVGKKKLKRRRPGKKLTTNLDSLADALPEMENEGGEDEDDDWEGISEDEENDGGMAGVEGFRKVKRRRRTPGGADAANRMKMTSLRHRPGAMKRKHRMEQDEMERFGRNLAQMVGSGQANVSDGQSGAVKSRQGDGSKSTEGEGAGAGAASQSDRWAALRRFIGGTMEQNQAFAGSK